MGTIWIQEFTGGLDTRRLPETTVGGVLIKARDGHITRGGEFEQRAAFVDTYTLPAGTTGLAFGLTGPVVFGSGSRPAALDTAIGYQQLVGSPTSGDLVRVLSYDLYAGKLYVVGEFLSGERLHFYDGQQVTDWFDGRARAQFTILSSAGGTADSVQDITVNGVSIITGPIANPGTVAALAAAIAQSINTKTSSPEYTATAVNNAVNIVSATASVVQNGYQVVATVTAGLSVSPSTGLQLAGGTDSAQLLVPGDFVRTIGTKMYSVSGPNLHFSGVAQPTKWTTDTDGAGFIDFSAQASGLEHLYACAEYQQYIAIFAERVTKIQYVDPDPTLNKAAQTLRNTGTASPRSVVQFGDSDVFYLDESGVRSLRARDASNAASTSDVGVPVDSLVTAKLASLGPGDRQRIIGLIEPRDGRYWLCVKDTIFVFSFFAGAKVSAWSTYQPGFDVDDAGVFARRVYLRSGDHIYVYGGLGADTVYDDTVAEAWPPYLDASKPTTRKQLEAIDVAASGVWDVAIGMEPTDLTAEVAIGRIHETTFNRGRIQASGQSTHFGLRFRSVGQGPHKIAAAVIQYAGGGPDAKA